MVIVRHPTAVQSNLLAAVPNQTRPAQPSPAQPNPVFSVAAPTATTSLLRCLFAVPVIAVVVVPLMLMLKLLQVAVKKKKIPKFAIYFSQLTS